MALLVDGEQVQKRTVQTRDPAEYEFLLAPNAGAHTVTLGFLNDAVARGEDRNLYIGSIELCSTSGDLEPKVASPDEVTADAVRLEAQVLAESDAGIARNEALAWLYRNCAFTLHPCFAEDWAQPVAESLAGGKYCVATTAPANAELAQGLLDLLDPLDFVAWHREVGRLLTDAGYRRTKESRIAAYRPRDWTSAGDQLVAEIAACLAAGASV